MNHNSLLPQTERFPTVHNMTPTASERFKEGSDQQNPKLLLHELDINDVRTHIRQG